MANQETKDMEAASESVAGKDGFWGKYGQYIFLGGFIAYFLLLLTGVIAEIFDIESILDWWIWRPPGKY